LALLALVVLPVWGNGQAQAGLIGVEPVFPAIHLLKDRPPPLTAAFDQIWGKPDPDFSSNELSNFPITLGPSPWDFHSRPCLEMSFLFEEIKRDPIAMAEFASNRGEPKVNQGSSNYSSFQVAGLPGSLVLAPFVRGLCSQLPGRPHAHQPFFDRLFRPPRFGG
jgi:hypothetical protein